MDRTDENGQGAREAAPEPELDLTRRQRAVCVSVLDEHGDVLDSYTVKINVDGEVPGSAVARHAVLALAVQLQPGFIPGEDGGERGGS